MTAREVFEQAREAQQRIASIEERSIVMHERIGIRGRTMGSMHGTSLDPMRKVDDLIDWESEEYDAVMDSSGQAIRDAKLLVEGLSRTWDPEVARLLECYYVHAWDRRDVCGECGYPWEVISEAFSMAFAHCDEVGMARLKEAGQ